MLLLLLLNVGSSILLEGAARDREGESARGTLEERLPLHRNLARARTAIGACNFCAKNYRVDSRTSTMMEGADNENAQCANSTHFRLGLLPFSPPLLLLSLAFAEKTESYSKGKRKRENEFGRLFQAKIVYHRPGRE